MKTLYIVDTLNQIGQEVELKGWINTKRDHKKIVFLDLRDKTGIVQVVGGEEFKTLSPEAVVSIRGIVKKRPDKLINPKILTGKIDKKLDEHFNFLDKEHLGLVKRVKRIETHFNIQPIADL